LLDLPLTMNNEILLSADAYTLYIPLEISFMLKSIICSDD